MMKNLAAAKLDSNMIIWNFCFVSILFSANHGCVVACLALATARFESVGAWQTAILYISYVGSSFLGAANVVKKIGSLHSIVLGMGLNCFYVGCFLVATTCNAFAVPAIILGAVIGGFGGGILWIAQGAFFAQSSEICAKSSDRSKAESTSLLAGLFAFTYLLLEVCLRLVSSIILKRFGVSWCTVFSIYTTIAIMATLWVRVLSQESTEISTNDCFDSLQTFEINATFRLLRDDPKMKYMFGLNAVFGLSAAYINSYVNGEVVKVVLDDDNSEDVGYLGAITVFVASMGCLLFGFIDEKIGKGVILTLGAFAFISVHVPFLMYPNVESWGWNTLVIVYSLHGIGRATFEGTLRATFADFFPKEKEGAFANIVLQNGLASAFGYILPFMLICVNVSSFCVKYSDGSMHNILAFDIIVIGTGILAILGYWKAHMLFQREKNYLLGYGKVLKKEEKLPLLQK